jgi:hypothetical protein
MSKEETTKILEAIEKCKEDITRSFDNLIEELKNE